MKLFVGLLADAGLFLKSVDACSSDFYCNCVCVGRGFQTIMAWLPRGLTVRYVRLCLVMCWEGDPLGFQTVFSRDQSRLLLRVSELIN